MTLQTPVPARLLTCVYTGLALTFCGLALEADAAPGPATKAKAETTDQAPMASMRRGLDWLKGMQADDGSWSSRNYPAVTALGLWAFTRSDHPDKEAVCKRAVSFIEKFIQPDGGIYKPKKLLRGGGLSTYNTAVCMIALHAYDRTAYAPVILKAREFMATCQLVGASSGAGGFGYEPPKPGKSARGWRSRGNLSNTGWAVQAMRVTQDLEDLRPTGDKRTDINWEATLEFLEKLQTQDPDDPVNHGGFGYDRGGSRGGTFVRKKDDTVQLRGYGSMTYAGLESMIYAQVDRTDPRVRSAIDWAARHWSVDKNPGQGQKGFFYYLNVMSKALSLYGTDTLESPDGTAIAWKNDLVSKLVSAQQQDGSWINPDNQFWEGDPVLVTAYVILSLEYALGL